MQVKNISGKEINVAGQLVPKDEIFNCNDCSEIRNLIREKYLEEVKENGFAKKKI